MQQPSSPAPTRPLQITKCSPIPSAPFTPSTLASQKAPPLQSVDIQKYISLVPSRCISLIRPGQGHLHGRQPVVHQHRRHGRTPLLRSLSMVPPRLPYHNTRFPIFLPRFPPGRHNRLVRLLHVHILIPHKCHPYLRRRVYELDRKIYTLRR